MLTDLPAIPDRLSFKIGEAAALVGVRPHVLRFWEKEFARVRPQKSRNGHRIYSRADVEFLRRIRGLLHDRGLTISGAKALLEDGEDAVEAVLTARPAEAAAALDEATARIEALEAALDTEREARVTAERELRRSREEAAFWRRAARRAEAASAHSAGLLREEIAVLNRLASANATDSG